MQKVYLLLRNNKQTGPHTLEELVQLAPKPQDLIWIEGRSAGWSYPSEIDALKPYLTYTPAAPAEKEKETGARSTASSGGNSRPNPLNKQTSQKVFVSLPLNRAASPIHTPAPAAESSLESRAEALRQRAQAYTPGSREEAQASAPLKTKYARTLNDVEEDFTSWMVQKKVHKKTFSGRPVAIAVIGILLVGVGYMIFKNTPSENNIAVTPLLTQPTTADKALDSATSDGIENGQEPETAITSDNIIASSKEKQVVEQKESSALPVKEEKEVAAAHTPPAKEKTMPPVILNNETATSPKSNEAETAATNEKKTIGQKIDGFFDKFKGKKKEETEAPSTTASTPADGGERKATRRGAEAAPETPELVNLSTQVDVTATQPSQNWMMGIKDVKLTLRNRSEATVKEAAVEVLYYNEQKELLEKKVVHFSNVPPKKSKTIAAPDHRLADHTDYRLLSANGF